MALVLADRVRETTTTAGTGTITLLGAVPSCQSFAVIGNGNTTYYTIVAYTGTEYEVGIGTYTASGTLLSRDTVLASSNGGSLVNFSAGTKDVFVDYPAGRAVYEDAAGNVDGYPITGGTIDNTVIGGTTPAAGTFTTLTAQTEVLKGTGQNFLLWSADFSNAVWGGVSSNVTRTTTTIDFTNASAYAYQLADPAVTGSTYTFSVTLSSTNKTAIAIRLVGSATSGGNQSLITLTATPTRYSVTATLPSGNTAFIAGFENRVGQGGDGSLGSITVSNAQLELGSTVNTYIATTTAKVYGTPTLSFSGVAGLGLQSDGSLYATSAGTGNVRFYTNNIGQEQARVSHTASAVNYLQFTGGATGGSTLISAQGSDTNINTTVSAKGFSSFINFTAAGTTDYRAFSVSTSGASNTGNYLQAKGNASGTGPVLSSVGNDTNIDLNLTPKGTGGLTSTINGGSFTVTRNSGINIMKLTAAGTQNLALQATGGGAVFLKTGDDALTQFVAQHNGSAVNYVQVTGAATGNSTTISAQGSDSNIGLQLNGKGSGGVYHNFFTITGTSYANKIIVSGNASGSAPYVQASGTDTNIPLVLQPKGTGALQAQQTDSTATGGNARGTNSVDWQTVRNSASQVANTATSVISGGRNNTATYDSFSGGGFNNNNAGQASVIAGGYSNTTAGTFSFIGGGQSNTTNGFYNIVVGGWTNSGTANAAVTTQSGTMNGTTAVTLSGSNANIKVGQFIQGTSIAGQTYVAAISGTSLTLSQAASGSSTSTLSFFTPHGVVVGGGNNQATGSYSFIGGGGDAGTAANRNVASGDWSAVVGGFKNVASGLQSFVGGGANNVSSGQNSIVAGGNGNQTVNVGATIAGGFVNQAQAYGFVGGGYLNYANGNSSVVSGGQFGTARSIAGYVAIPASVNPLGTGSLGNVQAAMLVLAKQTTDATATVITSDGSAASTVNQVILPNNSAYYFKGSVIANVTGAANGASWSFEGAIMRGANAASTVLMGTPAINRVAATAGATAWVIALTADTTNGGLAVTVTGAASTTIRWVCSVNTTECTF